MNRRKLITKVYLIHAYRTIAWFYTGNRKDGFDKSLSTMYTTCFYLDFNDNIYKDMVKDAILHKILRKEKSLDCL